MLISLTDVVLDLFQHVCTTNKYLSAVFTENCLSIYFPLQWWFVFNNNFSGLQAIYRRHCIIIPLIPFCNQLFILTLLYTLFYFFILISWYLNRQWLPAITVAKQHNKIRIRRPLATCNLVKAYVHGLLIEGRFLPHAPSQVDSLETITMLHAKFP